MSYQDFYDTSATSRDRTLRAYYWEQAATSDSRDVQGTDAMITVYKVFFQGREIKNLLKQEAVESMENEIKELTVQI